ncbi:hypothetical protein [Streptomyces lutosisoli]|uniref:DUF559 domain-containing protein n=1 Tax=Streptomyces lutosisoli TaxID=2665721 RepID=A0ABW2VX01_9ACTN
MKKAIYLAAAAAFLTAAAAAPAHANGKGDDGPVHIGVIGEKLKVQEVRALLDGHVAGARANLSLWQRGQWVKEVRGWKYSNARNVRGYQFEYVSWKFNNRSFPNNSQLCVEFDGHDHRACATIHD